MATFVLVHGSWHGGWAWTPVSRRLVEQGHQAYAPTMPGHGPGVERAGVTADACAEYLVRYFEERNVRDAILVGHSWGGVVLSLAAPRLLDRLQRLVYWSAFVLEPGECLLDTVPPPYVELFGQLAASTPDRSVMLPWEIWRDAFMQDAGEEAARMAYNLMTPEPMGSWESRVTTPTRDLAVARSYVYSTDDIALPRGDYSWVPRFPDRLGEHTYIKAPGSHEACFTQPTELADAFIAAGAL